MAHVIQCPGCRQSYSITAALAGKVVNCRACGSSFQVPAVTTPAPQDPGVGDLLDEGLPGQPPGPLPSSGTTPLGPAPTGPLGTVPTTVLPRRKWKPRASKQPFVLIGGAIMLVVLGTIGFVIGRHVASSVADALRGPVGKAGGVDGDDLGKEGLSIIEEMTFILSAITDVDSARLAGPQLLALERKRSAFFRDFQTFQRHATPKQHRLMDKRYGKKINTAGEKMEAEQRRVRAIPGVSRVLSQAADGPAMVAESSPRREWTPPASRQIEQETQRELQEIRRRQQERLQEFIRQHGADNVVTVRFDRLGGHLFGWIREELEEITGAQSVTNYEADQGYGITLAPVDDVRALAAKLHQGQVTQVDAQQRVIRVKVDPAKLPQRLPPAVTDAKDPRFYEQNLADLTCFDSSRRSSACWNLARVEPNQMQPQVARSLESCLSHRNPGVRRAAADTLVVWGTSDNVPALVARLDDEDSVVGAVLKALAVQKDERSADAVAALLTRDNVLVRMNAANCLKEMGPAAEAGVAPHVTHADPEVRRNAIGVLAEVATSESVPKLLEILQLDDAAAVRQALGALERIRDERAIEPVARLLASTSMRHQAKDCLKAHGPAAQDAVMEYVQHSDTSARMAAMEILEEIATKESVPDLISLLQEEDTFCRNKALVILGKIKDARAIAPATQLLLLPTSRSYASRCLKDFGPAAEDTVLKGLLHPDPIIVIECCGILKEIGTEKSFDSLLRLTRHKSAAIRSAAQAAGKEITKRVGPPKEAK